MIIGGGVIGCAIAWELARRGQRTTVVERGTPSREATWAAGGMLSPLGDPGTPRAFLELALASSQRFAAFAEAVGAASGIDVEYRTSGKLEVALDQQAVAGMAERHVWRREAGFAVEWLEADEARRLEPALSPAVHAGLLLARDDQVENRRLGRALWIAAARAGAAFRLGVPATGIRVVGVGRERHRMAAVILADGTLLATHRVVVAAGSWSGQLTGLPRRLPVSPVRGQMAAMTTVPPALQRVVLSTGTGCYLIPRADGRLIVGATVERDGGFDKRTTPAGIRWLLGAALETVPALADAPLEETWVGLRPGTPDDLPILGPDPRVQGLFYATGHFRNGILLAPITAEVIADLLTGMTPDVPVDAFAVRRFASDEDG